ncbi:hypothetical protein EDB81DRAFT_852014 [Dactylonectria macrodidyma]|uniref:Uncharacterized protein n=1 Tax=Dactylonectria macrodidyma TaxID=307937 RepID=A0A9P9FQ50_9HYPO|nr:hypothetical protein EDB81DRAFT_852014 [Dactylonectria macrodidyma]
MLSCAKLIIGQNWKEQIKSHIEPPAAVVPLMQKGKWNESLGNAALYLPRLALLPAVGPRYFLNHRHLRWFIHPSKMGLTVLARQHRQPLQVTTGWLSCSTYGRENLQVCTGQTTGEYYARKGAVVALAKALGTELVGKGIRVNSISPGYMATDMTLDLCNKYPFLGNIMNNEPPMRRMGDRNDLESYSAAAIYRPG